jgi:hypothetical protein
MFLLFFVVIKTPRTGSHAQRHISKNCILCPSPLIQGKIFCGQTVCPMYVNMTWTEMSKQSAVVRTSLFYSLTYPDTKYTTDARQKYIPTMTNVTTKSCDTLKLDKTAIKITAAYTSILRFLYVREVKRILRKLANIYRMYSNWILTGITHMFLVLTLFCLRLLRHSKLYHKVLACPEATKWLSLIYQVLMPYEI